MMNILPDKSLKFINTAIEQIRQSSSRSKGLVDHVLWRDWPYLRSPHSGLDAWRQVILRLEKVAHECELQSVETEGTTLEYPLYIEEVENAPIYEDCLTVRCFRPIVRREEIPKLLCLFPVPKTKEGMEIENHGFGYHFHYGKMKKNHSLSRTNLLLTFNPKEKGDDDSDYQRSLYNEYHADGKYINIAAETIGENKRRPIYLLCHDIGKKRGFEHFKFPGHDSEIFWK